MNAAQGKRILIKTISSEETLPIRHRVMWPNKPLDYVRLKEDPQGHHLGLFVDDQLVSVISYFIQGNQAQFRKFATLEFHQGKGYGSCLFEHLLEELKRQSTSLVWCNARDDANGFYKRYGFTERPASAFARGRVTYTIMEKKLDRE